MTQKEHIESLMKEREGVLNDLAKKLTKVVALRKSKEDEVPTLIIDNLFIGSYTSAVKQNILNHHHIKHVVSCIGHLPITYSSEGLDCLKLSFKDSSAEPLESHLQKAIQFIQNALLKSQPVLVHCFKGISRSSALIVGYLIYKLGISSEQALKFVQQKYPLANPNKGFLKQLKQFELKIKTSGMTKSPIKQTPSEQNTKQNKNDDNVDLLDLDVQIKPLVNSSSEIKGEDLLQIESLNTPAIEQTSNTNEQQKLINENKDQTVELQIIQGEKQPQQNNNFQNPITQQLKEEVTIQENIQNNIIDTNQNQQIKQNNTIQEDEQKTTKQTNTVEIIQQTKEQQNKQQVTESLEIETIDKQQVMTENQNINVKQETKQEVIQNNNQQQLPQQTITNTDEKQTQETNTIQNTIQSIQVQNTTQLLNEKIQTVTQITPSQSIVVQSNVQQKVQQKIEESVDKQQDKQEQKVEEKGGEVEKKKKKKNKKRR